MAITNYGSVITRVPEADVIAGQAVKATSDTQVAQATTETNFIGFIAQNATSASYQCPIIHRGFNGSFHVKVVGTVSAGGLGYVTGSTGYVTGSGTTAVVQFEKGGVDGDLVEAHYI